MLGGLRVPVIGRETVKGLRDILAQPWLRLREPKVINALLATAYVLVSVAGASLLLNPPAALAGHFLTCWVGWLLLAGGMLPLLSLHGGYWWIEKSGLMFLIGGLLAYIAAVWTLPVDLGEKAVRSILAWALVTFLIARWVHIRELDLDPDKP